MFDRSTQKTQEVIFFINDGGVEKEMMFTEFEAVLDGVVGLTEFADSTVYCVFVTINPGLTPQAFVFFTISFDEKGEPPEMWNIPFQNLIQKSARASMGAFEAKVVTRSACAIEWHRDGLWDPSSEVVDQLLHAIHENRLCLSTTTVDDAHSAHAVPSFASGPVMNFSAHQQKSKVPTAQTMPSLPDLVQEVAAKLSHAGGLNQEATRALEKELGTTIKDLNSELQAMGGKASELEEKNFSLREQMLAQKTEFAAQMKEQEARFIEKTVKAVAESRQALKQKYEKKLKTYEQEYKSRYSSKVSAIKSSASVASEALHEKSALLAEKDQLLVEKKEKLEELMQLDQMQKETIVEKDQRIEAFEHKVKQLSEELATFRKEKLRLMANGADKFFERLEKSGLNFIAFHPGAGHVSVSVSRVADYLNNPPAFAAEKVGLAEEAYLYWLHHYEHPCCQAPIMGGKTCGQKISRHENPRDFSPGMSDRCEKHRTGVSAAGRVFSS